LENVKRQRDRRAAVARQCRHARFDTDSNAIGHNYNRTRSVPEIQAEKYASLSRLAENTVLSSCKVSLQRSILDVWVWDATGTTPMYIHALRGRGWRLVMLRCCGRCGADADGNPPPMSKTGSVCGASCRGAEPQYHQNINKKLGLYSVGNGLSK